jgi:hypothetical protein
MRLSMQTIKQRESLIKALHMLQPKHPLPIKRLPYSQAKPLIRVGDGIGCHGNRPLSRAIRLFRGGVYDLSHWATIIRDREIGATGRVMLFEFIGSGPRMSYLSSAYTKEHGKVFWIPMHCTCEQQEAIIEEAADLEYNGTKYDFKSTWLAAFGKIFHDVKRFNCSECGWHLWLKAGRVKPRYHKDKPIAPVPGDVPVWAEATAVYELDMKA